VNRVLGTSSLALVAAAIVAFAIQFGATYVPRELQQAEDLYSVGLAVAIPLTLAFGPFLGGLIGGLISGVGVAVIGSVTGVLAGLIVGTALSEAPAGATTVLRTTIDPLLVIVLGTMSAGGHLAGVTARRQVSEA
jgi:predicted lipid-binding transport protein (Tim44 family)